MFATWLAKLPFTLVVEAPTLAEVRRWPRRPAFWLFLLVMATAGGTTWVARRHAESPQPAASTTVHVETTPAGARVLIDGQARGLTPTDVAMSSGKHVVRLELAGFAEAAYRLDLAHNGSDSISARLWKTQPQLVQLHPTVPGTTIGDAQFLRDGRVALTISFPTTGQQVWIIDSEGRSQQAGSSQLAQRVALSPNASSIATATANDRGGVATRATEVQVASASSSASSRTVYTTDPSVDEDITDLTWAPDGSHLLIAVSSHASSGAQTRLLWANTDGPSVKPLVQFPGEVVAGSYDWFADSSAVALLIHTQAAVALCVLQLPAGTLHYLGDTAAAPGSAAPFPPLSWSPDGTKVVYEGAPPANSLALGWFAAKPSIPLLISNVDGSETHKLPGPGALFPAWRPDQTLVGFAKPNSGKPVPLISLGPPSTGQTLAELPLPTSSQLGARWDLAHDQVLVSAADGGGFNPPAYWWVRLGSEAAA